MLRFTRHHEDSLQERLLIALNKLKCRPIVYAKNYDVESCARSYYNI